MEHEAHTPPPPRLVVMAVHEGAEILDITGPLSVFSAANALRAQSGGAAPLYSVRIAGEAGEAVVRCASGIRLMTDAAWTGLDGIDTLLVAGGPVAEHAPQALVDWLRETAPRVRRMGSICTGAFILARAGLLEGRRATTHWLKVEQLRAFSPNIEVQGDALHVKDGPVYTSAGVTAGIDLALALLEEDFGRALALEVARVLVLYLKRPGGQSQFSTALLAQFHEGGALAPTIQWLRDNHQRPLRNEDMAEHAAMSPRNFARVFKRETGTTPANFIEGIRLEAAVKRLEETTQALETIARECGFQSGEHFRLAFARRFGITPGQYRDRFRSGAWR